MKTGLDNTIKCPKQNQHPWRKRKLLLVNNILLQKSLGTMSPVFCDLHTSGKQARAAYAVQQH